MIAPNVTFNHLSTRSAPNHTLYSAQKIWKMIPRQTGSCSARVSVWPHTHVEAGASDDGFQHWCSSKHQS